ncbi:unnamed protein product [Urochloa decumbens]|uniref:Uncharacterized protein n=1 Tax=Urochloa decumbens TaxID=240449 RepID=A0ABC8WYB1_9POAL
MRLFKLISILLIALATVNVPWPVVVQARPVMRQPPAPRAGRSRSMVKPRLPPPPPPPQHHHGHNGHGMRSLPRPPPPYPPLDVQPLGPSAPPPLVTPPPCHH